jgi:hypothetical protein
VAGSLEPELSTWVKTYEPELGALERSLELSDGFVLFPIELPGPDVARELARWLESRGRGVVVLDPQLDGEWERLPADMFSVQAPPGGVVLVIGARLESASVRSGLRLLNQRRDTVAKHLGGPLLWCGSKAFLDLTWRQAPDFWSVADIPRRMGEAPAAVDPAEQATARHVREQRAEEAGGRWLLVNSPDSLVTCMRHGVWGRQHEREIRAYAPGDVFFAHESGGRGIVMMGRFTGKPFYDATPLWKRDARAFPWRMSFEPLGELQRGLSTKNVLASLRPGASPHWFSGFIQRSHKLSSEDFEALRRAFDAAQLRERSGSRGSTPNVADGLSPAVARPEAAGYGAHMPRATTLDEATKLLDPRPLDFLHPHPQGALVASDPAFYAAPPGNKGADGFKLPAPIERLRKRLLSGTRTTKLFLSGHVGSGKSTELSRLIVDPEIRARFAVIPLALEEHEWATLDAAQLLFRIGAALYVAHKELLVKAEGWKKKLKLLNERIFEPMGIQAKEGSLAIEVDVLIVKLRQELKLSEKARQQFRDFGETQRTILQDFIEALVDDIENALTEEDGPNELLVVVDDLDKLRTEDQHRDIFDTNLSAILAPPLRILYTVPTAVRFGDVRSEIRQSGEDLFPVRVLTKAPGTWKPEDAYTNERIGFFELVVDRRIAPGLIDRDAVRLAAIYSGGVLRDFFRLLREGVLLALYNDMKVLDGVAMRYAIEEECRRESIGLYTPDYEALVHVHRTNSLPGASDRRYLALSRVIECFNGAVWFEANPVLWHVLEEHVKRIDAEPARP